jgi:hypothetical protein
MRFNGCQQGFERPSSGQARLDSLNLTLAPPRLPPAQGLEQLVHVTLERMAHLEVVRLERLPVLQKVHLQQCPALHTVQVASTLSSLQELHLLHCGALRALQAIQPRPRGPHVDTLLPPPSLLPALTALVIRACDSAFDVADLGAMPALLHLDVAQCTTLVTLLAPGFHSHVPALQHLHVYSCPALAAMPALCMLSCLQRLEVGFCGRLQRLVVRQCSRTLTRLELCCAGSAGAQLDGLERLVRLRRLQLDRSLGLQQLHCIGSMPHLEHLEVNAEGASQPWHLSLAPLTALTSLQLRGFARAALAGLRGLSRLRHADLSGVADLQPDDLCELSGLSHLTALRLEDTRAIDRLPDAISSVLGGLQLLYVSDCYALARLPRALGLAARPQSVKISGAALREVPAALLLAYHGVNMEGDSGRITALRCRGARPALPTAAGSASAALRAPLTGSFELGPGRMEAEDCEDAHGMLALAHACSVTRLELQSCGA